MTPLPRRLFNIIVGTGLLLVALPGLLMLACYVAWDWIKDRRR